MKTKTCILDILNVFFWFNAFCWYCKEDEPCQYLNTSKTDEVLNVLIFSQRT